MEPEVWRRVSDLFSECLSLPETERTTFLARLETTDSAIAAEIRKLLTTYGRDEAFLEAPAVRDDAEFLRPRESSSASAEQFAPELRVPRGRKSRRKSPAFWLFLTGNLVVLLCFLFAASVLVQHRGSVANVGWWAEPTTQGFLVNEVYDEGPATGILQVDDDIQSINGKTVWLAEIQNVLPGAKYSAHVLRHGQPLDLVLKKEIITNPRWPGATLAYLVVSLTFFLTAIVVSVVRPGPKIITLAWAALVGEAVTLLCMLLRWYAGYFFGGTYTVFLWMQIIDGPHFAFSFHFYTRVFSGDRRGRVASALVWLFYIWSIAAATYNIAVFSRHPWNPLLSFLWIHMGLWSRVVTLESAFYLVAPLSICFAVAYSYLRAQGLEEKRRARWIAVGSLAGILPYVILRLANTLGISAPDFSGPAAIVPAALIPVATGYAILKHRLFDIHVVLRRGLQYVVARNGLRLTLALPAVALLYSLATNVNRTIAEVVLHNYVFIVLVVLIAVVLRFQGRVAGWLDKRFFREGYQQERILLALIDDLRNLDSIPEMGVRVGTELVAAMHPESVYFFYSSPKTRAYIQGFGTDQRAEGLQIPEGSALPALLANNDQALSVESLPTNGSALMSWSWLYALRLDLIVPLNRADGSPVGFLLLGRKKSEEPYSPADRRLLLGLAHQMAVSCENLLLQERVLRQQKSNEQMRSRVEGLGTAWLQECPHCGRCFDCSIHVCTDDGNELVLSSPVHRLLDGRYRLDRVLGRGGMGTVFEAMDLRLHRQVAVKLVQAGRTANPAWPRRFGREARALARLNHENIVLTYDFGVVDDEVAYLVMELVSGTTLRAEVERGSMSPAIAASRFGELLEGVKAAHAAGIVHRDLKPENLLIAHLPDGRERVKIADFGIAKWQTPDAESASLTLPGTIVGSLRYMSPEQLTGLPVDARSDLFSIGVMVFEVLTGKLPFAGGSHAERMASAFQELEIPESAFCGAPELRATLQKCLARSASDRFATAGDLQSALIPQLLSSRLDPRNAEISL
jgi:eukaryotic-like serine/threonine-protein kinase